MSEDRSTPDGGVNPELLKHAIADRDSRPWRYYRYEREDLKKWLEKVADERDAIGAQLSALQQEQERTLVRVETLAEIVKVRSSELDAMRGARDAQRDRAEAAERQVTSLTAEKAAQAQAIAQLRARTTWQPIETAPKDGTPFLVSWCPPRCRESRVPLVDMVGGWNEYQEYRSYGEPEAYGWHPIPRALTSPMTVAPAAPREETPTPARKENDD